ncbi:putative Tetratricopeptide repeat protein [Azospirillaceae bacterium]
MKKTDIQKTLNLATAEHSRGNLAAAERLYRQILKVQPNNVEVIHRLGVACLSQNHLSDAIVFLKRTLVFAPKFAAAYSNLAVALRRAGQNTEAIASLRQAVSLEPTNITFIVNLGNALLTADLFDEAETTYRQALALTPEDPNALSQLGFALMNIESRAAESESCLRRSLAADPNNLSAATNLCLLMCKVGRRKEVIDLARATVNRAPNDSLAASALGLALSDESPSESLAWLRRSIALNPRQDNIWNSIGIREQEQGQIEDALNAYENALKINPNNREARFNRGRSLLLVGRWTEGWPDYEFRWGTAMTEIPVQTRPRWDGSSFENRTLLLYSEQGLGDTLQFMRYIPLVKQRGGKIILGVPKAVSGLLEGSPDIDMFVVSDTPLPPFDIQCPLLSLPLVFGTTPENTPPVIPLPHPTSAEVARWKQEIPQDERLKVGLVWTGNPDFPADRERSPGFDVISPLFETPNTLFVGVQVGPGLEAIRDRNLPPHFIELGSRVQSFVDTAAIMLNLDLVISSCTSPLHLAGSLNVPTWSMQPFVPDWRWMMNSETTPWYPSMRLFRQPKRGAWGPVIETISAQLRALSEPSAARSTDRRAMSGADIVL